MSQLSPLSVLRQIRQLVGPPQTEEVSDGELLETFISHHDEIAFETLLERHGPMVFGVCRRLLRDPHLIEDAFQATFLVLVRKAGSINRRESVGSWLHGVARHIALRAHSAHARRNHLEKETADVQIPTSSVDSRQDELHSVVDEEVQRLPEKYRTPLVLCYLEGKTNEEAARHMGCPTGTIFTRLSRGREMLRTRLVRRGVALSATLTASSLLGGNLSAAVPTALQLTTLQAATQLAMGKAVASVSVSALVEETIRTLTTARWKIISALLLALASTGLVLAAAVAPLTQGTPEGNEFPRRLLTIHVQHHLFAESVQAGGAKRDLQTLTNALSLRLQIPAAQTMLLDEGDGKSSPLVKPLLEQSIANYLDTSRPQDRIVLLFIGHATAIKDKAYLVPFEGELHTPDSLIAFDWLYERLARCKARQKILILDLCRLNPNREPRRAGNEQMSGTLDKALRSPPEGVQIWSACVAGQNSCTTEGVGGSVFLDKLHNALEGDALRRISLGIQQPEDSIPIHRLALGDTDRPGVDNSTELEVERLYKRKQTPRLTGAESTTVIRAKDRMPAPKRLTFDRKVRQDPLSMGLYQTTVHLDKHELATQSTFRGDLPKVRNDVSQIQRSLALSHVELNETLESLENLQKQREKETSKHWGVSYDYTVARVKARIASTYEYNYLLSEIRGETLPPLEPGHTGWRLVPEEKMKSNGQDGKQAKQLAKAAQQLIENLEADQTVPWKKNAERDNIFMVGLKWESVP